MLPDSVLRRQQQLLRDCVETPGSITEAQLQAQLRGSPLPSYCGHEDDMEPDLLPTECFSEVSWLANHGMRMFRHEGDESSWLTFALQLSSECDSLIDETVARTIAEATNCPIELRMELLRGEWTRFIIFRRGDGVEESKKHAFDAALAQVSALLRQHFSQSKVAERSSGRRRGPQIATAHINRAPSFPSSTPLSGILASTKP